MLRSFSYTASPYVLEKNIQIDDMILKRESIIEIKHKIRQHSYSVFEAGIMKVIEGVTTLEEVIRVSKIGD